MEASALARERGPLVLRSRRILAGFGDDRLVEQLRRGNDVAFEVIFDRHHRGVLSFCRHLLGSLDEAEDAVQQTFASAYTSLHGSDREVALKAWLYTIARNRCLSTLRARREQPAELEEVSTAGLAAEVEQRSELRELVGDLAELREDQRTALVLTELGDLSHVEVAAVVGCEAAKVKSLVYQARSALLERRDARETPCTEVREQLATLRGGSLRRGTLRRHVAACPSCAAFGADVKRQRQLLAIALPVIPSLALKEAVLAAVGIGGSVVAGAAGATAAGGGLATAAGVSGGAAGGVAAAKVGAAKIAVLIATGGAAVGGGATVADRDEPVRGKPAPAVVAPASGAAPAGVAPTPAAPATGPQRAGGGEAAGERGGAAPGMDAAPGERDADRSGPDGRERDSGLDGRRGPGFDAGPGPRGDRGGEGPRAGGRRRDGADRPLWERDPGREGSAWTGTRAPRQATPDLRAPSEAPTPLR